MIDEVHEVKRLAREEGTTERKLDYVQVVFGLEWFGDEDSAVAMVGDLVTADEGNPRAVLLHSHSALHLLMDDESIAKARRLLSAVPVESVYRPMAATHLAAINERHGAERSDRELTFRLISESVDRAPEFVSNNAWLGRLYARRGETTEARHYLARAKANILPKGEARDRLSLVERAWHECFTGCLSTPVGIELDLDKLA
ncbi:tetratricopeptide repeat protein [Streptomyces sp. NPDC057137]|uniref:tetratricopeptide repeat protein n=1 Tax=Streptomyces sp. NPDC057137 TaxID=3346030 RepID=UPI0036361E2F